MQLAMAKFKNGDFRSGYYRDQTFMMAIELTIEQFLRDCMEILLLSKSQCQQEDKWGTFCHTQFKCRWIMENLTQQKKF
jgi:hypothetical protein